MIPTTLGIALVIFLLYQAAPGDPALVMMGNAGTPLGQDSDIEARIDKFRRRHGLDRSLPVQFLNYIGPFNLLRDGHPWFTSPYGEREVETVEIEDGTALAMGTPMPIPFVPGTPEAERDLASEAVERLLDEAAGEEAWAAASGDLGALAEAGVPAVLSALDDLRSHVAGAAPAVQRLDTALVRATGHDHAAEGDLAGLDLESRIRHWFGWYYIHGGDRVQNSGAKPWGGLLAFDLGQEMQRKTAVADELLSRLKVTVPLSLISVLISYAVALPLGIFSVRRQGTKLDGAATLFLFVLYSIPTFWAGLMLILAFGVTGLDWLPVLGLYDKDHESLSAWGKAWDIALHSILPIATLSYASFAYLSRQMRAGMLEVIRQDYIRTARAKGLSERVVVYKHALRNSLIPIVTLFATVLPVLIGGSIIVEKVFDIPGMGKYAFEGLLRRDFYIVMATTIFVGIMTQLGILLSDVTYSLVDPRIRHD